MPCTLGRASLPSPDSIRQEGGGKLRIGHSGYPFAGDEGLVMAQQLLGYPSPDEEVVFFTYDAQAANQILDGAYFVLSTDVDWVKLAAGVFSWSAELMPTPSMQLPTFEVSCWGDDRDTVHALDGQGWVGLPAAVLSRVLPPAYDTGDAPLVGGGTVDVFAHDDLYDFAVSYSVDPADVYEGAAQLTVEGSVVTGRQTVKSSLGWVVDNGLVRVRPSLTELNHLVVGIADSTGTAYTEFSWRLGVFNLEPKEVGYDGTTRYGPVGVTVLRNSPECVAIRVLYPGSYLNQFDGGGHSAITTSLSVDVTLRRGQPYAEFNVAFDNQVVDMWGVWRGSVDASASVTGGVEDAAAVGGIKWRVYTPLNRTADNTNGGLYVDDGGLSVLQFPFAIGNDQDIYGLGATFDFHDAYFAAQEHHQQIVAR